MRKLTLLLFAVALVAAGSCNKDHRTLKPEELEEGQLWEGSPYWASANIGADNPWDYGLYFSWGNIIGYAPVDGSFSYSFDKNSYSSTGGSKLSGNIPANEEYDAAQANLGGKWRMPTKDELKALMDNCDKEWFDGETKKYYEKPVAGMLFRGRGEYSGNGIFLPAAGGGGFIALYNEGAGYYWSSTLDTSSEENSQADMLTFYSGRPVMSTEARIAGFPIRPVSQ